jgi:hypothetical protein
MGQVIEMPRRPPEPDDGSVRCPACTRALGTSTNRGRYVLVEIPCRCGCAGAVLVRAETGGAG